MEKKTYRIVRANTEWNKDWDNPPSPYPGSYKMAKRNPSNWYINLTYDELIALMETNCNNVVDSNQSGIILDKFNDQLTICIYDGYIE